MGEPGSAAQSEPSTGRTTCLSSYRPHHRLGLYTAQVDPDITGTGPGTGPTLQVHWQPTGMELEVNQLTQNVQEQFSVLK